MMKENANTGIGVGSRCVAGLFHDDAQADNAMEKLKEAGFSQSDIGMATAGARESVEHTGFWNKVSNLFGKHEHAEAASELQGSLDLCGLPQQEAQYFTDSLAEGCVLLTLHASSPERATMARDILQNAGADMATGAATASRPASKTVQGERRIQLLGELLRVHKERVQRGEVRLRKEVVTEKQHVEVPVTREELVIERTPVQAGEATGQVGTGEEIRIPLTEEQVRIEKKPVVTEEIRVGKKEVQDTKRIDDTVRREELHTEREGNVEIPSQVTEQKKPAA